MTAPKIYRKILCIPDIHFPYANYEAIKQIYAWKKKHKPDLVIFLGDITDSKAWSKYSKDPDDDSPQTEFDRAEADMKQLHKMFPKAICLIGNHDVRPMSKALEAGLPRQLINSLDKVFAYPGWEWHISNKPFVAHVPDAKIAFIHGDESKGTPGQKASKLGMSVVQGHTHQASLEYITTFNHRVFGIECGHVADLESKGMKYAAKNPTSCTTCFVSIIDGIPQIHPL